MSALPLISLLATGGTIAGSAADKSSIVGYKPGSISVEDILSSVPTIKDLANIRAIQVCNIGSEDMTDEIWFDLARKIQSQVEDPEVTGVVVTHGTDTLEETAFFLNLVIHTDKPIVLVGSMRPATSISADGPMNLLEAIKVASCPQAKGKGVLVVLNDEIHGARDVTKTNTTSCSTFASPLFGAIGILPGGEPLFIKESVKPHTTKSEFSIKDLDRAKKLPRVDIIYAHANSDSVLIDASIRAGAKGIVYSGMGNGSIHKDSLPGIMRAVERGVIVVRASRTGSGAVVQNQPIWDQAGILASGTLNPQKARILLQLSLLKGYGAEAIEQCYLRY